MMAGRRRHPWLATLVIVVVLALASSTVVVLAQPRVVVGDPLPQHWALRYGPKPDPPKASTIPADVALVSDKPPAVDLVQEPAPVSVASPEDPAVQSLALRLQQAIATAGDVGQSAVHVIDADGRVVFDLNGSVPLIPASTAKLVTAAALLAALGPDHTFTTRLRTAAPPDAAGVIAGDLVLVGGGDPTLVSTAFVEQQVNPERPQTPIEDLADQLLLAGVTRVEGAVLGDPGFLQGAPLADGWQDNYLDDRDASYIAGLTIDQGLAFTDDEGTVRVSTAIDPPVEAAAALTAALITRGITVGAPPASVPGAAAQTAVELAAIESPPLIAQLVRMVQRSDNHLADTLFRVVGRRVEGNGSFPDGAEMTRRMLADLQLDWSTTSLQDGSGLSRTTMIPPGLLTTLNYRMTNSSVGAAWQELMAVSGVSGTLQARLTSTIAELRLRGKTGSLRDVRALSGAVVGPDGRPLYFSVTSNAISGPQLANARRLQDLVALALAAELYACTELPPDPEALPPQGNLPPLPEHVCAP